MEPFDLSVLFWAIRGIVPVLDVMLSQKCFYDIGDKFFSLIGADLLNDERSPSQHLLKEVDRILGISGLVALGEDPACSIIDDSVDDLTLFVSKRILGIHLKLLAGDLMGIELFLPL